MAGDATKIRVWESGDVFVWDPKVTHDATTAIPKDALTALPAGWKPCGLMLGDPGVSMTRSVERTDVNSWQQGRVLERIKSPKVDITFTLLEDNEVSLDLIGQEDVPSVKKRFLALEFVDDSGNVKRWYTVAEARLFVNNDSQQQDVKGREISASLVPVAGKLWKIQESAAPKAAPAVAGAAAGTPAVGASGTPAAGATAGATGGSTGP